IPLITCNDHDSDQVFEALFDRQSAGFYAGYDLPVERRLERLVYQVSRKPRSLAAHLERIYFCFRNYLNEPLFAALVDLQLVLNKRGRPLSERVIHGSRSRLTESQFQALDNYLKQEDARDESLPCSRYALFTRGIQSATVLVQMAEADNGAAIDPLQLARDFVEYSQLEDAHRVLEQAIMTQPERMELHDELLSLYRSTRNQTDFKRIYQALAENGVKLPDEWTQLHDFFKGLSTNAGK
ncbi:MAG: type IV pilus assembly protein FimV, partial [Gammaproteobacteria bacterium]